MNENKPRIKGSLLFGIERPGHVDTEGPAGVKDRIHLTLTKNELGTYLSIVSVQQMHMQA